jgi:large subunit ribosomal protein L15
MSFGAHTIKAAKGARRTTKRVGRGDGSGKGNTSARGMKGQRSRSGGKSGTAWIGLRQSIRKIPKLRGFTSQATKSATVTLGMLESAFENGDTVSPSVLEKKGLINTSKGGVKIVATGELTKKLVITRCHASAGALKLIEKAGGSLNTN